MISLISTDSWLTLKYHFQAWRLLGIYPSADEGRYWRYLYSIYACVLNFITVIFPISFVISTLQATNMAEFCERGFIVVPDVLCSIKFIQTWYLIDRLLALRPVMESLDERLNLPLEHLCIKKGRQLTWRVLAMIVGLFICLWFSALPLAFLTNGRELTFPGYFPWDWQSTTLRFVFTNCFQYACLTLQATQDIFSDSYPLALLSMVGAHIRALGIRVQSIGEKKEADTRFQRRKMRTEGQKQSEAEAELIDCIKDHQLLLKLLDTILEIISPTCFYQFASTASSVCIMGGFLLFVDLDFKAQINLFFFFAISVMETLLVCSSGEMIYNECEQLTVAIYSCNWYNHDVKFQRTLLLMMRRSQQIKEVMAAKFIPVRISTFVTVMKGSYSMFTLLCNMHSKKSTKEIV